ncbi:LysR family transcriptional regulator [Litoribacillus peritrichatus]|uniref:LysR family transcriptional regulator n=1 Tax=Litoribacillus peritrichatus TaxID=718191 RepID=A0ABP7MFF3_9GAMM
MHSLRKIDLNTLVTLKVLLDEKHVTHAAEQLNLTQSAVSRTLAKLRDQFDDPLLVKSGKHLARTAKAERLYEPLTQILNQIESLIEPEAFNPETATGTIRIATTDYGTHTLLPRLTPVLTQTAPGIRLIAVDWRSNLLTELEENNVDLIIGGAKQPPPDIFQKILASDDFVCVIRKDHPKKEHFSFGDYLSLKHVVISPSGEGKSTVDILLAKQGYERQVAVKVPHFFAALEIIANTDFVILLPRHFVRRYVDSARFTTVEAPFDIPGFEISMFWHARMHQDPLHKWFRGFVNTEIYEKRSRRASSDRDLLP